MEGLKAIPYIALVLAVSGIVIGAGAITLSSFGDTMTQCSPAGTYNRTIGECDNASQHVVGNVTPEYNTVLNGLAGQNTIAEQLPTVAIIGVMVIIISIIAGVFVYFRYFG